MTDKPLRILLAGLNYEPEPTGIAPYTAGLARGLARRGHIVQTLTAFPHYPQWRIADGYGGWAQSENRDGVGVRRLRHYIPQGRNGLTRAVSEASFGARLVASAWSAPDVVVCVSPALISSSMTVARARGGFRRPAVGLIVQDLYSVGLAETQGLGRFGRALTGLESWTAKHADGVAVIHDRFKRSVAESLGVQNDAISVVRNWTHIQHVAEFDRDAVRRAHGWEGKKVVLHAGAMGEKQNLGNVVEAARIADQQHSGLHFVLMGDGNQRRLLESQAAGLRTVEFLDPLPDEEYGRAIRSADALLVNEKPGVVEMAVPSKLTSYFSTGVPVLAATDPMSTTSEEILASGAGVQTSPGDPQGLVDAAVALCLDPARADAVGARGPRYCSEVLNEEQAIDGYENWIRDLTARARARRGES